MHSESTGVDVPETLVPADVRGVLPGVEEHGEPPVICCMSRDVGSPRGDVMEMSRRQLDTYATRLGFLLLEQRTVPTIPAPVDFLISGSCVYAILTRPAQGQVSVLRFPSGEAKLSIGGRDRSEDLQLARDAVGETRIVVDTPGLPFLRAVGVITYPHVDLPAGIRTLQVEGVRVRGLSLAGTFAHEIEQPETMVNVFHQLVARFPEYK